MKYIAFGILILMAVSCKKDKWDISSTTCSSNDSLNLSYSKAAVLQQIMDKYTAIGLPGVAIAVYSPEGYWAGASGYAKIEDKTLMQPCNLQYSQSVSKTYLAVEILQLYEEGKIDLDAVITKYLPQDVISKVTGADKMTVRMLLNHTSGVDEYNDDPRYVSYLLDHPLHLFTTMDYLHYIDGKPVLFEAGSKYLYTNTNYELLAIIADQITGDHAKYMHDHIFVPLGLANTFYHESADYLDKPELVNSYWDRYSNNQLENCSEMEMVNVKSLIGDDGMIATPMDYVRFLKGLFEGQLLTQPTMDQMLTIVKNNSSDDYGYGLGIHSETYNGHLQYGHTGGGIGAGCFLGYFPDKNVYFFIAINIGTSINSPLFDKVGELPNDVFDVLTQ